MLEANIREFEASDGYCLHYRHWQAAASPPRASIVALHGIQSHSGWYEYSSRKIAEAGYELYFLDRRGSGLNPARRGDAPHSDRLINDVVQFITAVRHHSIGDGPAESVVLSGLSWGGKLAVATCARRPEIIDALVLSYPGICARVRPRWHQAVALELARISGIRQRRVPIPLNDPCLFTFAPEWQEFIDSDPLALRDVTVQFLLANRELDRLAALAPAKIDCPVLLMLAARDRIIDNAATRRYFDRLACQDKRVIEYPEAAHTLEFEPNRDVWIADLVDWLAKHASRRSEDNSASGC